jgi:hypothetical protein
LLFFATKSPILSVKEMRNLLIKTLTIDKFIQYQNGNLVNDFTTFNKNKNNDTIDINKYKNSKLFTKINMNNPEEVVYLKKVVSALENFKKYLKDDYAIITHTYLWDIVSMPNKELFVDGLNLVILQIPNDDITNNVQLLCPSNHYSTQIYESRKPTVLIIKDGDYYEPIYSYTTNETKLSITKMFKERAQLSPTMKAVFNEIIKPLFNTICRPKESMPTTYKMKRSLLLFHLIERLDKYHYTIVKLVINFNNKVIGLIAEEPAPSVLKGFIPCYPSAIDDNLKENLDYVFMTDLSLWNTYDATVNFLMKLYNRSKKRRTEADIPCKPVFKIIEDEMIVGLLTETNQFIQVSEPIEESNIATNYEIPSLNNNNYIVNVKNKPLVSTEVPTTTSTNIDKERVQHIQKIKLENNFYNVFRNTIRILLNDYNNSDIRDKIKDTVSNKFIMYNEQLDNLEELIKELVGDKIQFIDDNRDYNLINDVSTCILKDENECNSTVCAFSNSNCNLILPKYNLITKKDNSEIYFVKMADELIRYNRIRSFMFEPEKYLSLGNVEYDLHEDEIIMLQSLITQEYFESLIPTTKNEYQTYTSYDEVEPIKTQVYENTVSLANYGIGKNSSGIKSCEPVISNIKSMLWNNCFPNTYKEIEYGNTSYCTFDFMIALLEKTTSHKKTMNEIKSDLYNEYIKYFTHQNKIVDILIIEGKKTLGDLVKSKTLSFSNFIYTDDYFLTLLDIWILVNKYKIPTIFISSKTILQTNYTKEIFVGYSNDDDKFVFIVVPSFKHQSIPKLKFIETDNNDVFINMNRLDTECISKIKNSLEEKISVEKYLDTFKKPMNKIKRTQPNKRPLIIEEDEDEGLKNDDNDNNDKNVNNKNDNNKNDNNKNDKKPKVKKYTTIKKTPLIIDDNINVTNNNTINNNATNNATTNKIFIIV